MAEIQFRPAYLGALAQFRSMQPPYFVTPGYLLRRKRRDFVVDRDGRTFKAVLIARTYRIKA